MGIISFKGESISMFSAVSMVLSIFELGGASNTYDAIAEIVIGVFYIVFLIKAIITIPKFFKYMISILKPKTTRADLKSTLSQAMKGYYANIARQFILLVVSAIVGSMYFTSTSLIYFSVGLAIFLFGYIVRLRLISNGVMDYMIGIANAVLYLFGLFSALYYSCTPAVQACYQNLMALKDIDLEINFKSFFIISYSYFIENILFVVITVIVLYSFKNMFSDTTESDIYFFESKGASKKIVTLSCIMLACRNVINIYLQSDGYVNTNDAFAVLKYVFAANRFDLIPLLIVGICMMLITSYDTSGKKN